MPTFTLNGQTYAYLQPILDAKPQDARSWEYEHWPRVEAQVPLAGGEAVSVYGEAMRWAGEQIIVRWKDDDGHYHQAWVPANAVRKLTASEWDIIEYHATPANLRSIRWGKRLPGFLPE